MKTIGLEEKKEKSLKEVENFYQIADGIPSDKKEAIVDALKENYSTLLAQEEVIVMLINDDLRIEFISNTICESLFYTPQTLIKESIFSILTSDTHETMMNSIQKVKNKPNKALRLHNLTLYCALGYEHYFDGMIINLHHNPRVKGYMLYLHNITERRKTENLLKDLNLELDSFVYKASHDLRAPLASLAGLIYLTENEFPPEAKENFEMMKHSVNKLDKFIQQLAHYSRNNNTETNFVAIDFKNLIQDTIDSYKYLANADKIHFQVHIPNDMKVISDNFRLKVILGNLISNAIKYHQVKQDFPFIHITLKQDEKNLTIVVEDNGVGIHKDYQDRIFEMFSRTSDYSNGSGLGLYITRKALEKLRGTIKVNSVVGKGSRFEVKIPLLNQKK